MASKKELAYFRIDGGLGGNQSWFSDWSMYFGGCAAVTACDLCLYLARYRGREELYPYDPESLSRQDFLAFGKQMKPYLHPRSHGIDRLSIYTEGITKYWRDRGVSDLQVEELSGDLSVGAAWSAIRAQLDNDIPIPFLLLKHRRRRLQEYVWHWFILAGYREEGVRRNVKVITYGESTWLDFDELWDTGYRQKGGAILVREPKDKNTEESYMPGAHFDS